MNYGDGQFETPCFIIDKEHLDNNINSLFSAINTYWSNPIVGYSFKTNNLPWLLTYLRNQGFYAEVVSGLEYDLALRMGYPPEHIIYNGPIKSEESFRYAIKHGSLVNIDSKIELEYIKSLDKELQGPCHIGVRVNVDLETYCPGQAQMGTLGGRFGFSDDTEELGSCLRAIQDTNHFVLNCLHVHSNSKTRSLEVFESLANFACIIIRKHKLNPEYLDIGGGFFGGPDAKDSFIDYFRTIQKVLKDYNLEDIQLIVEPGAAIIASPVEYACKVIDIKDTSRNRFIVLDGTRVHIDPMKHKNSYKYTIKIKDGDLIHTQVLVGSTCLEDDRFMLLHDEKKLEVGDEIVFKQNGSYTMVFNPLFINYLPKVYVKESGQHCLVRDKWNKNEFLQKNYWDEV